MVIKILATYVASYVKSLYKRLYRKSWSWYQCIVAIPFCRHNYNIMTSNKNPITQLPYCYPIINHYVYSVAKS